MDNKVFVGELHNSGECWETYYYRLIVTPALLARIQQLSQAAAALGVYKISEFFYDFDVFTANIDTEDLQAALTEEVIEAILEERQERVDCGILNVTSDGIFLDVHLKHAANLETGTISLESLK
jgi:hypothetical protein